MIKRGRILRDTNAGSGLLTVEGTQYQFVLEGMWKSEVPPRVGMPVDVSFTNEGAPDRVTAVPESQLAHEQVEKALSGARRQGEAVKSGLTKRFGMGIVIAEALLFLSFFFLHCLLVENPMGFGGTALTGWQATGFDPKSAMGSEHGILSLLAVPCLLAPLAVPFVKRAGAHWLHAAPLTYLIVTTLVIYSQAASAAQSAGAEIGSVLGAAAARQMSRDMTAQIHFGAGAWLATACAIYLFIRAFRKQPVND